jgi:hypothetical protein
MAEHKEQFDNNFDLKVSGRLKNDLDSIYKPDFEIPQQVDMAILNKASQKLKRSRSSIRILRWIGPVAAAAAIIIFISLPKLQKQKASITPAETLASISTDFDMNGQVDILDAFKLAKLIQSEVSVDNKWDINGDGQVDGGDVDEIAIVAVSLD